MKRVVFLVFLVLGLWFSTRQSPANWKGMPAPRDPQQVTTGVPAAFQHEGLTIEPLARYSVTAVVLSRDRYRFDPGAKIAPVDLALGWGPMSVAGVINGLKITQGGRFYEYSWREEPPLDPDQIISHSANTHCIPATPLVRRKLLQVKRHERVTLEGYLVQVSGDDGFVWRSSLTRADSGGGACELIWVTDVQRSAISAARAGGEL